MFRSRQYIATALSTYAVITAAFTISARVVFAEEDCSRKISIEQHPFPIPQTWTVRKNFIIPEGQTKLYSIAGQPISTDVPKAAHCVLQTKSASPNPREFRTHEGETNNGVRVLPRAIQIGGVGFREVIDKQFAFCTFSDDCTATVDSYKRRGWEPAGSECWAYDSIGCTKYRLKFTHRVPVKSAPIFNVQNDKTLLRISCEGVTNYNELKLILEDYFSGIKCPEIETEEASIKSKKVDEDATIKAGVPNDTTADAVELKKASGQKTH